MGGMRCGFLGWTAVRSHVCVTWGRDGSLNKSLDGWEKLSQGRDRRKVHSVDSVYEREGALRLQAALAGLT